MGGGIDMASVQRLSRGDALVGYADDLAPGQKIRPGDPSMGLGEAREDLSGRRSGRGSAPLTNIPVGGQLWVVDGIRPDGTI